MLKNNSVFCDMKLKKREQGEPCKLLSNRRKGPLNCYHRAQSGLYHFCYRRLNQPVPPVARCWPTGGAKCGNHQLKGLATINQCFAVPTRWFLTEQKTACFSSLNIFCIELDPSLFFQRQWFSLQMWDKKTHWLFGKLRHPFPCCNLTLTSIPNSILNTSL